MKLAEFSREEQKIIYECLSAAAEGPFFPEWEFQTLFGVARTKLKEILRSWPIIDETDEDVVLAISNSMANLIGYPHGEHEVWSKFISASTQEVATILKKWNAHRGKL